MIFELMSNGTLAKLPIEFLPDGILNIETDAHEVQESLPFAEECEHEHGQDHDHESEKNPFVVLLLPHNRYILGTAPAGDEHWVWGKPGGVARNIFLYDNEKLSLPQGGAGHDENESLVLPAEVVTFLKRELLRQIQPPGDHQATVLLMRSFMQSYPVFADELTFQDEAAFMQAMNNDETLQKIYWTLRFAMARSESDIVPRLKAWLKAGSELFAGSQELADTSSPKNLGGMKIWFSIMDLPDESVIKELETLSFSREDLNHMVMQQVSPLLLFNPRSGYLVLLKMNQMNQQDPTQQGSTAGFNIWAYVSPKFWLKLREIRKLTVREILMALWGQHDIEQAMEIRSHYALSAGQASPVMTN